MREAHSFSQASLLHLFFARRGTDLVITFVQEEQKRALYNADSSKYFANLENPVDIVWIRATFSDRHVQSRSHDEKGHLEREEMGLEQAVGQEKRSLPVGFFDRLCDNLGIDSTLKGLFRVDIKVAVDIGIMGMLSIGC